MNDFFDKNSDWIFGIFFGGVIYVLFKEYMNGYFNNENMIDGNFSWIKGIFIGGIIYVLVYKRKKIF